MIRDVELLLEPEATYHRVEYTATFGVVMIIDESAKSFL